MNIKLNRRRALLGAAGIVICASSTSVWAHRLTTTTTQIEINSETGEIDVIHDFHVHDTGIALAGEGILDSPNLAALKERAQLALYTEKSFTLYQNGSSIPLEIIGAELVRGSVLVYQQGKIDLPVGGLSVRAEMMRKFVPDQINNVDVVIDGKVTSLQFRGSDDLKKVLA